MASEKKSAIQRFKDAKNALDEHGEAETAKHGKRRVVESDEYLSLNAGVNDALKGLSPFQRFLRG